VLALAARVEYEQRTRGATLTLGECARGRAAGVGILVVVVVVVVVDSIDVITRARSLLFRSASAAHRRVSSIITVHFVVSDLIVVSVRNCVIVVIVASLMDE
jgi:hypothetical protein